MAEQQQPKFRIQDDPSIIETYANKFLGAVFDGSAVIVPLGRSGSILKKRIKRATQGHNPSSKSPIA